jgi:hypothetical protein
MTEAKELPRNHVLAVVDGSDAAAKTVVELSNAGFNETLSLHGTEFQEAVGSNDDKTGNFIVKALKSIPESLSEESNYLAQYQEQASRGRSIIAVKAANHEEAEAIGEVLRRSGAGNVRFFGALAVSDLSGIANPSAKEAVTPGPTPTP